MKKKIWISIKLILIMTVLTGIIYPLAVTLISKAAFSNSSEGSLIRSKNGNVIGSELLGQKFDSLKYFIPRPSLISYNPMPSGASNWGPTSDTLKKTIEFRRKEYARINMLDSATRLPDDAIFASGSGVDPHISLENAIIQAKRIIKIRNLDSERKENLMEIIYRLIERPQFGILGEERINVLKLNIELDKL